MTNPATGRMIDPLGAFVSAHITRTGSRPIPLISTRYDIHIDGGFAVVESRRVFRNSEAASIEATLTFPLPVDAVLFSLEAENDGRKLKARARRRDRARAVYETAIDEGKAAVLHEELLRGIHMLSVAHIAPGTEIAVTTRWATTLTWIGERWTLCIPLTVGQVYGRSPLADSDALESGGANGIAEVFIHRASGRISLAGADVADGHAEVPLNRPIDIEVIGADARKLRGTSADGRAIALEIAPLPAGRDTLDLAILVDRSGSMGEACTGGQSSGSKHNAVIAGLNTFARQLRPGDDAELWEFDNTATRVGAIRDERPHWRIVRHGWKPDAVFDLLVRRLRRPDGGTQLGSALEQVLRESPVRDVLLITDGKSYALDVQKMTRYGRRVAVVMVGEDRLEATVGHLAGLTGGCMFMAIGKDIAPAVAAAAATLRSCAVERAPIEGQPESIEVVRGGALVKASWAGSSTDAADAPLGSGVAAMAAGLALARMQADWAAEFAEREGLCSHLTSLVLVDEDAPAQEGIPAMRKVQLAALEPDMALACMALIAEERMPDASMSFRGFVSRRRASPPDRALFRLSSPRSIDWDAAPAQLLDGDLSTLDKDLAERLREASDMPMVQFWADELNVNPMVLIIAALAHRDRNRSRSADRIARRILGDPPPIWIDQIGRLASVLMRPE